MWISTIFIVTLALGSLNLAASEEKIADEKTVVAAEKVQEKRQISGHTKVPTKFSNDFTPLIYGGGGNQVTAGLGQYTIPEDPATYASSAATRKLPNNANSNYLKLTQGQLSPSVAPQQFHVEKGAHQQPVFLHQAPRVNTISDAEYLQLIQNAQKYQAAAAQPQPQHFIPFLPHQGAAAAGGGAVFLGQRQYAQLYQKPSGHPLGDSSLEREIEKLVAANAAPQQAASSQRQSTKVTKGRQFLPKNPHNFVFIPYQPQALQQFIPQQQQYAAAAAIPQAAAIKQQQPQQFFADYQAASKFHQFLPQQAQFIPILPHQVQPLQQLQAHHQHQQHQQQEIPLASPIHSYHQHHQKAPPSPPQTVHNSQFPTTKPAEVKKQQQQPKPEQTQQKPHSSIYVSQSTSTPPFASPTKQSHYTAKPASHSQESQHSSQPAQVSVSTLAESIFKTPPSQQRPLTQQEFQALVDAGYPVTPIHVPVPVPIAAADKYENHQNQGGQLQAAAYAAQQQYASHKFAPQTAGSQYQPAILAPTTFYAPQPSQQYYQQQRQQRDTTKETQS